MALIDGLRSAWDSVTKAVGTAGEEAAQAVDTVKEKGERVALFASDTFERAKTMAHGIGKIATEPERVGRVLRDDEIAFLKDEVFGDSVDLSKVRIVEGDEAYTKLSDNSPMTLGNTIYVPRDRGPIWQALLAHEMVHVWQYQNGGSDYFPKALYAQTAGDGYDFKKGIDEGKTFAELNPEQQAELIDQAVHAGAFESKDARFIYVEKNEAGTSVTVNDYTDFLRSALAELKAGHGAP